MEQWYIFFFFFDKSTSNFFFYTILFSISFIIFQFSYKTFHYNFFLLFSIHFLVVKTDRRTCWCAIVSLSLSLAAYTRYHIHSKMISQYNSINTEFFMHTLHLLWEMMLNRLRLQYWMISVLVCCCIAVVVVFFFVWIGLMGPNMRKHIHDFFVFAAKTL